ncbi:hypothetical protein [Histidinibacterium lentulum]|uniref:Uncharacterized protein n=1 Tax=Histidinibacterium lentulum TaxID=2480588 RepID=A0A3N2R7Y9_9RHOB|nr:hypothetical protein [Histidinibacterium lentulum]ROU03590.1 hypothetical protein EAT49_04650 [Histidinibacterium lentulum]
MINIDDIEDMTCLTRGEIAAIAEHEHVGELNAALLGEYLMHVHHGAHRVNEMICEDIRAALHRGETGHARELFAVLRTFIADHPEAARG